MDPAVTGFLAVLGSLAGGYFGSYFNKKGENKALQEDIAALTKTTKQIEAKISNEVWDRQKQWEMKREVLFVAAKRIAEMEEALAGLSATLQVEQKPDNLGFAESTHKKINQWSEASAKFDEVTLLVAIVCKKETKEAMENFRTAAVNVALAIMHGKDAKIYQTSVPGRSLTLFTARSALRKELGIE
jgi:hypothetical protein